MRIPRASSRSGREAPRTGMAGREFRLLLAATFSSFAGFAPLLSVVPLWAAEGGAGHAGVGAATGVTMGATVAVQLCMGRLLRWLPLRRMLLLGSLLLGVPVFAYALSAGLGWVLTVSAVRGAGFGMVVVAGSALVADLVPVSRRGRAIGLYGIAVGLPSVIFLPLGVWCAERFGFSVVFVAAGVFGALSLPLVAAMSRRRSAPGEAAGQSGRGGPAGAPLPAAGHAAPGPHKPAVGYRALAAPWLLMITAACALGGVTSFLPLALDAPSAAPWALFVLSSGVIAGRWAAGVRSDRMGVVGGLLPVAVAACAAGMAGFAVATEVTTGVTALAVAAALAYGVGFGALQNDTLVVMFHRAGPQGIGRASTAWNMAYDAGTGAGSFAIGLLAHAFGLRGAFLVSAVVIALALPLAWRETPRKQRVRHAGQEPRSPEED
ncbi:MFS transporter [Streptomyces sp. ACA25]|uniref:MFS transporter n=1 Tax=Streptomyces sp. ACA25 TaxID=3022596 RepID=UPI0023076569|nr:MFS transporter [Streptomyces sp. ACA25]MDB1087599.1 MFS transporter [Streptomyces sp. ACA25]